MKNKELKVYEIPMNMLNSLVCIGIGLKWNQGSLFEGIEATKNMEFGNYQAYISDGDFVTIAKIMTEPSRWIVQRIGGGQTALQAAHLYVSDQVKDSLVLITLDQESDQFVIQLHSGIQSFTEWIVEHFCSSTQELSVNYIPPMLSLSQFMMIFHLIDSYKRITYGNMLNYRYTETPKLSSKEFFRTLGDSLASNDVRWLLPTLTSLVPSINKYNYQIDPEDLKILLELDFIDGIVPDDQGGELILSNIGIYNGIEFLKHWMLSIGFECYDLGEGKNNLKKMFYVAPSRLTNHMIEFLVDDQNSLQVNHQVCTKELLIYKLNNIFHEFLSTNEVEKTSTEVIGEPAVAETIQDSVSMNDRPEFCSQCGSKLLPEAKFCNSCGAKVN